MTATNELLELCEWGLRTLADRVASHALNEADRRYAQPYECPAIEPVELPRWLEGLADTPVVAIGDFHPDPGTKVGALDLLTRLSLLGHRPVVALEQIEGRHQMLLDDYVVGRAEDADVRRVLPLDGWDTPWHHVQGFFHLARFAGWPLLALDDRNARHPAERDRVMAGRLADSIARRPHSTHFAVVGESHLHPEHLATHLADRGIACHRVFVNHLQAWKHAPIGGASGPHAFRLDAQTSAWVCSTPLERPFHLPAEDLEDDEFLAELTGRMAGLLGLPVPDLDAQSWMLGPPSRFAEFVERCVPSRHRLWDRLHETLGGLVVSRPAAVLASRSDLGSAAGLALWSLSGAPRAAQNEPTPTELIWIGAVVELGRQMLAPNGRTGSEERTHRGFWLGQLPANDRRPIRHAGLAMVEAGERLGLHLTREFTHGRKRDELRAFLLDAEVVGERIERWRRERRLQA